MTLFKLIAPKANQHKKVSEYRKRHIINYATRVFNRKRNFKTVSSKNYGNFYISHISLHHHNHKTF